MRTLKQFYRQMQAWIDDGCPEHEVFSRRCGLCVNLASWAWGDDFNFDLKNQFDEAGLHRRHPFNGGNPEQYLNELDRYKNPARLAWIKEHAA